MRSTFDPTTLTPWLGDLARSRSLCRRLPQRSRHRPAVRPVLRAARKRHRTERIGTGKSTLIRCINSLERLDGGRISVDGRRVDVPAPLKFVYGFVADYIKWWRVRHPPNLPAHAVQPGLRHVP